MEPKDVLPDATALIERFNTTPAPLSPPETMQSCNDREIAEGSLRDKCCTDRCKPIAECTDPLQRCNGVATPDAIVNPLDGNEKSPTVARLHGFSEGIEAGAEPAPDGATYPQVCQHCGAPATTDAPVQLCAVDGEEYLLHPACRADFLGVSLPPFLQRGPNNG